MKVVLFCGGWHAAYLRGDAPWMLWENHAL